jgi:preprotein translocase subunit SecG
VKGRLQFTGSSDEIDGKRSLVLELKDYLDIALIIISVLLILSVILQSKGAGLGGLSGADTGSVYTARRGVERTLFRLTIILSAIFFVLVLTVVLYFG